MLVATWLRLNSVSAAQPPNIVLILADDMGLTDLSCFGAKDWETPHLDRMASDGIKLTNFHVTSAVCSASRASILTGRYHNRAGISGALKPGDPTGLPPEEKTLAEILKNNGYKTGMAGKWHLGSLQHQLPVHHGFDQWFGLPYSNDMWPVEYDGTPAQKGSRKLRWPPLPLYEGTNTIEIISTLEDQNTLTTRYTEYAVDFIKKNKDNPFFLYLAHSMPHVPLGVSKKFRGKSRQGLYGDVMMEIDWSVGEVLTTLQKNDLETNTLVIFTSDNGPWLSFGNHSGTCNGLRGGKGTAWQGGIRVPAIMYWPGTIPAGSACDQLVSTMEILPTVTALTGSPLPDKPIDGIDISALLTGAPGAHARSILYCYYKPNDLCAVIMNQWKLVFPHEYREYLGVPTGQDGKYGPPTRNTTPKALFNLETDAGEQNNLLLKAPEIAARLDNIAHHAREDLGDHLMEAKRCNCQQPCAQK